jgi:hypothetical protein
VRETYVVQPFPGRICIVYRGTPVITYAPNGGITLKTAGWRTVTTKRRMNQHTNARIFAKRGIWYVNYDGRTVEFAENLLINPPIHAFRNYDLPLSC